MCAQGWYIAGIKNGLHRFVKMISPPLIVDDIDNWNPSLCTCTLRKFFYNFMQRCNLFTIDVKTVFRVYTTERFPLNPL